ncbi:MAG TPA: NUDIX hydrolase [Nitrososphaeraceae archaeon]|jgi:ADP-ribose pyrophosphatase|nr:NUDIX hydrolase [Nitrososphaeraceae archaeon]
MLKNSPNNDWRILNSKKVYSNEYIQLYEDLLNINGTNKVYIRGKRKNYSTVVPFLSDREVLVIRSYRHLVDSIQFEIPSGYIEEGESPIDAAQREFNEETGYITDNIVFVGEYTLDYSMFEQKGYIYAAYDLVKKNEQNLGLMESIKIESLTIEELKNMLFSGQILNAASIVALYKSFDFHEKYIKEKENVINT